MTHKKIKEFIVEYKDYQILFIFIFTILGGLTQVLELALISTYYIRFFSITQVISDGLLFVFLLSLISLVAYIFHPILLIVEKKEIKKGKTRIKRIGNVTFQGLKNFFIMFTLFLIITAGILIFSQSARILLGRLWILILLCALLSIYFVIFFKIASFAHLKLSKIKGIPEKNIFEDIKGTRLIVVSFTIIVAILFFIYKATLTKPTAFVNDNYIKCFIQEEYPDKEYDIRYFNDKYIFIVIKDTDENKLEREKTLVLEFNNFFNYKACN